MSYALRSAALSEQGQHALALEAIEKSIELAPNELLYRVYKVKHFVMEGQWNEAFALIRMLLDGCVTPVEDSNIARVLQAVRENIQPLIDSEGQDNFECKGAIISSEVEHESVEEPNFDFDYRFRVESNESSGRHLVTSDPLQPDTLLLKEKPYSMVLLSEVRWQNCHYCARNVYRCFWPCTDCNYAVYCNATCQRQHWSHCHRLECGLTGWWTGRSISQFHVFRLLNRIGLDAMLSLDQRCDLPPYDMFTYMHDWEQQIKSEEEKSEHAKLMAFKALRTLEHHSDRYKASYMPEHMITSIECAIMNAIVQGYGKTLLQSILIF